MGPSCIVCFIKYWLFLVLMACVVFETMRYELMFFQQNSYKPKRYFKSIKGNFKSIRFISNVVLFVLLLFFRSSLTITCAITLLSAFVFYKVRFVYKYKKPIVYTVRLIRLMVVNSLLILGLAAVVYFYDYSFVYSSLALALVIESVFVVLSYLILMPLDFLINRYYYNDAKKILKDHKNLIIIGITGSYGKTSTKSYLNRILSERYNVLMTPGNYNTTLGVIITIRKYLKSYHDVFIVEMGAKNIGDIKEICDLVNPSIGIITSVGEQHLESFKTIENVQKTKFELIDALPEDGLAVLNADYPFVSNRDMSRSVVKDVRFYSVVKGCVDCFVDSLVYSKGKTSFDVMAKGEKIGSVSTKLLGKYNISNLLACYVVARYLGCSDGVISNAIKDLEPVEHRLSIRRTSAGFIILDDAYNSNPAGSQMALEVLGAFNSEVSEGSRSKGGLDDAGKSVKKIVITPGMIELGAKQYDYNRKFGVDIAQNATDAFVVGRYNRVAISDGLKEAGFDFEHVHLCENLNQAVEMMSKIVRSGDVVLYENDLPDTFK